MSIEDIVEDFSYFDDWEQRYSYLIELGTRLPAFDPNDQIEANIVKGCTSKVWMVSTIRNGKLYFNATSDAIIVRGLIYLLYEAYNGKNVIDLAAIDIESMFAQIGLDQNLSPNRRNGFFAMVKRIQGVGAAAEGSA